MSHAYGIMCKCGDKIIYECFRRSPERARKLIPLIPKLIEMHNTTLKAFGDTDVDIECLFYFYSSEGDRVRPDWYASHAEHGGFEPCVDYGKTLDELEKEWGFPIGRDG